MYRVLVTGTGGRSIGSGIVRSLMQANQNEKKWHVIAADLDNYSYGLYAADEGLLLPSAKQDNYLEELKKIAIDKKIDAIIPGTEIETILLANNKAFFENVKIICNKATLMPLMIDKVEAMETLAEMGFPVIPTIRLSNKENRLQDLKYPLVLKPYKNSGGSKGVKLITSMEEFNELSRGLDLDDFCVQEYVGDGDSEYTVGVICHHDGSLIDSIVIRRKLHGLSLLESREHGEKNYKISTGYSQGFVVNDAKIKEFCEALALKLGSCGPLNIQLRRQDDQLYVFELHPRFSGTTPIRSSVGFTEVEVLLLNYLEDKHFERLDYQSEVAVIRSFDHVVVPMDEML